MADAAGAALSEKAAIIAKALNLDPSLPLAELVARANAATGMTIGAHVSSVQMQQADRLLAAARTRTRGAASEENKQNQPNAAKCRSCGQLVERVSKANGCCIECISQIHDAERKGHSALDKAEARAMDDVGGSGAHSYGEITPLGFRTLSARLALSERDVFVDAGSGLGTTLLQAVREGGVRRAIGVEFSQSRHRLAQQAVGAAEAGVRARVHLICGDCAAAHLWRPARKPGGARDGAVQAAADESGMSEGDELQVEAAPADDAGALADATVLFTCSLMFSDELMARLARCIEACPTIRLVASLRRFPESAARPESDGAPLRGFAEQPPPLTCETSWMAPRTIGGAMDVSRASNPGSMVYLYTRTDAREGTAQATAAAREGANAAARPHTDGIDDAGLIASLRRSLDTLDTQADSIGAKLDLALERRARRAVGQGRGHASPPGERDDEVMRGVRHGATRSDEADASSRPVEEAAGLLALVTTPASGASAWVFVG